MPKTGHRRTAATANYHDRVGFIELDESLQDLDGTALAVRLGMSLGRAGHRAPLTQFEGLNAEFDAVAAKQGQLGDGYEDQCSGQYYFDLYDVISGLAGQAPGVGPNRILEVGVFMGGASVILAGAADRFGMQLDLLDINANYLRYAGERARRAYPGVEIRLFLGDVASYVSEVLLLDPAVRLFVQHDGAHNFNQVLFDLSALSFVKDRISGLAMQDTNLRGMPQYVNFVDAAAYAVFGPGFPYRPIGSYYSTPEMMKPNQNEGNYFLPDLPEGMFLEVSQLQFRYPHPHISLAEFIGGAP